MKKVASTIMGLFIAVSLLFVSCSKDSDTNPAPPQLPPQSSMSTVSGNFTSSQATNTTADTETNFQFAAANVIFWQALIGVDLAIPAATFREAFNHSFHYLKDENRWKSEYSIEVGNQNINAELYAEKNGNSFSWEMYLSSPGRFNNFLWFSGESALDNSGGKWIINKSAAEPRQALIIDWEKSEGNLVNSSYLLVDNLSDKEGSSIAYGTSEDSNYSHYYNVSVVSESNDDYDLAVLYHDQSRRGRVKSTSHFGDSEWRCWGSDLADVDCQ